MSSDELKKRVREIVYQLHINANRNPGKESVDTAEQAIYGLMLELIKDLQRKAKAISRGKGASSG